MKCPNCDKELDENAKFCDECGSKIESTQSDIETENKEDVSKPQEQEEKEVSISVNTKESPKKKSNAMLFAVLGVVLAALAIGVALIALNKSSKANIKSLEKAIENTVNAGNKSGTITATISMGDDKDSFDLSGIVKYQIIDDNGIKMQISVNKSMFFDEMSLYLNADKSNINLYAKNSLIDMFMGTSSNTDSWVSLSAPIEDSGLNLDSINESKQDFSLDSIEEYIKYSGKKDGLDCYTLVIDNNFIDKAKEKATDEQKQILNESLSQLTGGTTKLEKPYTINFYVNSEKELQKVSLDMEEYAKQLNMKKLVLTIELKDTNSTVVDIPNEAITSSIDLEKYISENYSDYDYNLDDEEFNFDYDLDNEDFDF